MDLRRRSFFLRHILFSALALWLLIALGVVFATPLITRLPVFRPDLNGHQVSGIAEVLEAALDGRAPEAVVEKIGAAAGSGDLAGDLFIADESGRILAGSQGARLDDGIDPRYLPKRPREVATLNGRAPSPGDPALIRLEGTPARFLVFRPRVRVSPEQIMMLSILGVLTLVTFAGIGTSSLILLKKLRAHGEQVALVMSRLKQGELSARLEVRKLDEFGNLMHQFNTMADEIEGLFRKLQETERARLHFLQDISHDLRTPISSLLSLFEILHDKFDRLPDPEKREFIAAGRREVRFIQRLVVDLLFLARVEDPVCLSRAESVDLSALLREEIDARSVLSSVDLSSDIPPGVAVSGDAQLLQRMVRNALDNSISFARNRVAVSLENRDDRVEIHLDDDGPGFSADALKYFGQKRPTRILHEADGRRISLGLGSVIMAAIARLHSGAVTPRNRVEGGQITGSRVSISIATAGTSALIRRAG